MDYYAINKVLQQPDTSDIKLETLSVFSKLNSAEVYISNITHLIVSKSEVIVGTLDESPTDDNMDGYYLVKDTENKRKFYIYQKKTEVCRGYIYNSVDIKVVKYGFLEISHIRVEKEEGENQILLINSSNTSQCKVDKIQMGLNDQLIEEFKKTMGQGLLRNKSKKE